MGSVPEERGLPFRQGKNAKTVSLIDVFLWRLLPPPSESDMAHSPSTKKLVA
jgi:hypothetical protein